MTLQVASLIRPSSRKQHGAENNRSLLSTCSQVIRPWHLKVQHGKPCHTFKKLDVSPGNKCCSRYFVNAVSTVEQVCNLFPMSSGKGFPGSKNLQTDLTDDT